jgi:hypothetical protein
MEEISEILDYICPLSFASKDGPHNCVKKNCAWWQVYYEGLENEYGECAIKSITCLQDLVPV